MKRFALRQRGLTIIEAMAWLVLFALIMLGVFKTISSGYDGQKESMTQQDIIDISAAALKMKNISPTFAGISCANLVTDKYIVNQWTSCTAVNPFGGNYTAGPNSSNAVHLDVTATGLPQEVCRRLANTFSKTTVASCSGSVLSVTFGS